VRDIPPPPLDRVVSADGTPLAFTRHGQGPSLLLVHGATVDRQAWQFLTPHLQDHFAVYALDRRGRGASGDTPPYAVEREIEDLQAVLTALPGPVHLFGHSSGAVLALETARRAAPGQIPRLLLYEPPLFPDLPRLPPGHAAELAALLAAGNHDRALRTFLGAGPPGLSPAAIDQMAASPRWGRTLALAHTLPYDARIVGEYDLRPERLAGRTRPSALLLGETSPPRQRAAVEATAAALPGSQIIILPGQEHVAMVTAPELLAAVIIRFCRAPD